MRRLLLILIIVCAFSVPAYAITPTNQKRGSLISMGLPMRTWVAEPNGELNADDRMSIMGFGSWNFVPDWLTINPCD